MGGFFSAEAGQKRRKWLDDTISENMRYFLGPTGLPERLNMAAVLNPVNDVGQAMSDARTVASPDASGRDRFNAGVSAATNMATVLAPIAGAKAGGDGVSALADSLLGFGAPARQGAKDAAGQFARNEYGGIRAYHGSPHDFDEFRMDGRRVGIGDQAFGDGLYFADTEDAAKVYMDRTRKPNIDGKSIYGAGLSDDAQELVWKYANENGDGTVKDVADAARADLASRQGDLPFSAVRHYNELISELDGMADAKITMPGKVYEVDIDADPSSMFDWDAPAPQDPNRTGGEWFRGREDVVGRKRATEELKAQGYPGVVYNVGRGDRSRKDYVVFDERLINIVKKYGIAGAAGMLGMSVDDVEAAMQNASE